MAPRVTYRKHNSYNTRSNRIRKVKTPGGRITVQYPSKTADAPRCSEVYIFFLSLKLQYNSPIAILLWMEFLMLDLTSLSNSRNVEEPFLAPTEDHCATTASRIGIAKFNIELLLFLLHSELSELSSLKKLRSSRKSWLDNDLCTYNYFR